MGRKIPPKVEHELTDLGRSLITPLTLLADWAFENRPAMENACLPTTRNTTDRRSNSPRHLSKTVSNLRPFDRQG
ncbi:winged helix-turn-helix transcriptional regulator [Rhizobium leguminosarum]|uniref:winged helix-turn-helix transcriptional regulator n=1 Tax=Rhizobium leguminosarum TaxID=384 RepID=UPI0015BC12D8|nr:winged helix-turn-helix transcriptional regulator [Rhizobium leguminosarum]MBY5783803.1 winged helix-turn-helix transcriptional regulator [Rhizobium leguminosarum]MBY5796415.1 winged helix-turn-helix transcriptional regulator [Rhizobium leguminosarum]